MVINHYFFCIKNVKKMSKQIKILTLKILSNMIIIDNRMKGMIYYENRNNK